MQNETVMNRSRSQVLTSLADIVAGVGRGLSGSTGRRGMLSLVDQGLVSGANFCVSVLVGRFAGPAELGLYFLGFTLITFLTTAQISLISTPYTIYTHRHTDREQTTFAGSVLLHQAMLSAILVVALAAGALVLWTIGQKPGAAAVAATLAVAIPFVLLREFARRFCFAHMKIADGLVVDFGTVVLQVAVLVWLSRAGQLTAVTALATLGAACAVSSVVWLWKSRSAFHIAVRESITHLWRNFALAKWVFAAECGASLLVLSGPWLTAALIGSGAAGMYAACFTLVQAINPILFGTYNMLAPHAARAFAAGGTAEVRRVILNVIPIIGVALVGWCACIFLFGEWLITTLYGDRYPNTVWVASILALAMLLRSLGVVALQGLQTIERPEFGLWANFASLAVILAVAPILIPQWGVVGAASSVLAANATGFLIRMAAFWRLSRAAQPAGALS